MFTTYLYVYLLGFQKRGVNKINMVNNSNLPANIKNERSKVEPFEKMLKFITGPTRSNPGPILPKQATTALKLVNKLYPSKETNRVPAKRVRIYKNTKPVIAETVSMGKDFFPIFKATNALGCNLTEIPLLINFKMTSKRITFIPPPVEEEQLPTSIKVRRIILLKVGHKS